ncbi:hypothetical protein [Anatilimnocola floriformis]|uniref:hypothetical protein n=1 Tax=Anatilimnocola floriformis TaxID=2948575 RepID=UPI0020C59019|nr:hypothetical protein [Anatilimnocola floriformis]
MSDSLLTLPEQLRFIHEQITAGRLAADSLIPAINSELSRMHEAGIVAPAIFVGNVVLRRSYYPNQGPDDSGQLVVAVLNIPGGLGACYFDCDEFLHVESDIRELSNVASAKVISYADLDSHAKACLLNQVGPLISAFIATIDIALR